jgi:hypothetical protein
MQESTAVFGDETDEDYTAETSRTLTAQQCETILGIPPATVRSWANRERIFSRGLDGAGNPLYYEHELVRLRDARRVALAGRVATMQHKRSSTRVSTDRVLSCVRGQGGVVPDKTPPRIVVPVELDTSKAEQQLDEFCDRIVRRVSAAMATGLAVSSVTVAIEGPKS